jgi:hypothetical protein
MYRAVVGMQLGFLLRRLEVRRVRVAAAVEDEVPEHHRIKHVRGRPLRTGRQAGGSSVMYSQCDVPPMVQ